jgi:zinc/manganese transport system substrate-binding protein
VPKPQKGTLACHSFTVILWRCGRGWPTWARPVVASCLLAAVLADCATGPTATPGRGRGISVVAAENLWGSIANQLGGDRVMVRSIITNPDTDPHDYRATAHDARQLATAQFVIVNGAGYDPWTRGLLTAHPLPGRTILDVGELVGVPVGANPHFWYDPALVHQVVRQIAADYKRIDPRHASYFSRKKSALEAHYFARYDSLVNSIRTKYAGTPIGASDNVVIPLAAALDLNVLTPRSFLDAISQGNRPTVADKTVIDAQIRQKQIKVYVSNSQDATSDVAAEVQAAESEGVQVATVTETLAPADISFQEWQVRELRDLQAALARATGH